MAKDRRTRDQKRKDKLAKRKQKATKNESLAYLGEKYKTDKLIPFWLSTETGIYEIDVISGRKLLDQEVVNALEKLIRNIRAGTVESTDPTSPLKYDENIRSEPVYQNVLVHWKRFFLEEWKPSRSQQIGVLRTILGSIEKVRLPNPRSQTYLRHIAGFLTRQVGLKVELVDEKMQTLSAPEEDELVVLGRRWAREKDQEARAKFHQIVADLFDRGEQTRVLNSCHEILGELEDPDSPIATELIEISNQTKRMSVASSN